MLNYSDCDALLLLKMLEGLGLRRRHKLLQIASPSTLINGIDDLENDIIGVIGRALFDKLKGLIKDDALQSEKDALYKAGVTAIAYTDAEYPESLKEVFEFPTIIYCMGNVKLLKTRCISVVGTRNPSRYGVNVTRDFTAEFVRAGLTVVSGFARGIDSTAHKMTTELEAPTIAVIANGLDICYPAENRSLRDKILSTNGLIVSEYRLGTQAATYNFPERNRIISALSEGLFVPEMTIKSGTMITVNHALEQGKNVYVVPSNINSPSGEGSNMLIKSMQGSIVLTPSDVLADYRIDLDEKKKENYQFSLVEQQILSELARGETHVEQLIELTGLSVNELASVTLEMEMNDLIEKTTGNYYILK